MATKGKWRGGLIRNLELAEKNYHIYKQINKVLLYSTGNYIQLLVINYIRKKIKWSYGAEKKIHWAENIVFAVFSVIFNKNVH